MAVTVLFCCQVISAQRPQAGNNQQGKVEIIGKIIDKDTE